MLGLQEPISERYLIQHLLHHGYMSDVYHAYDQHLQCDVAIKLVRTIKLNQGCVYRVKYIP